MIRVLIVARPWSTSAATLAAVFDAPPGMMVRRLISTTGTGASGEILRTSPQMYSCQDGVHDSRPIPGHEVGGQTVWTSGEQNRSAAGGAACFDIRSLLADHERTRQVDLQVPGRDPQ
jgi:hypothetical protein